MVMKTPHFLARQLAFPSGIFGKYVIRPLLNLANAAHNRLVLEALSIKPEDRVLEVGFGGGFLLREIARLTANGQAVGVDISSTMAKATRRKFLKEQDLRSVHFLIGSAASLPAQNLHFDKVCAVNVVYFWRDVSATLTELHRVIRPDGSLVLGFGSDIEMRKAGLHERGFNLYSASALSKILEDHGFSDGRLTEYSDSLGTGYAIAADRLE